MTTGTGVNDGQGHSLPDGAGVAPDESKGAVSSAAPAPVPVPDGQDPVVLWKSALAAVRLLGREVRRLRAELEER